MKDASGTWGLLRFSLRRDRVLLPIWIAIVVVMAAFSAAAGSGLFPTMDDRRIAASAINDSPAFVAMLGRVYDPTSLGSLSLIKLTTFGAAMVAVIAIMLVVRHTRRDEELGRFELLGSTRIGRAAPLMSALLLGWSAMAAIGVLTALGLTVAGLPAGGSWAFGLAWASTGMVFASIAAVAAQVTSSARVANGIALSVLGVAYALRGIGDVTGTADSPSLASWLSPIGWGQQVRAFAGDQWLVLALPVMAAVLLAGAALALAARRDLGAGLLPDRPGPARGSARLGTPLGLAWRLQRGVLLGWAIAFVLYGFIAGNLVSSVDSFASSEQFRRLIETLGGTDQLTDAYLAYMFSIAALLTAAYGVAVTLRLRTEEESGHAELVLAASVSRTRWLASHLLVALVGTTALSVIIGVTAGLASAQQAGSIDSALPILGAALAFLPAIWVFTGFVVLMFGFAPRLTVLAWGLLVGLALVAELGPAVNLPAWTLDLSPFAHIPRLPGAAMTWTPLVVLMVIAAALVALGIVRFRQRDIVSA